MTINFYDEVAGKHLTLPEGWRLPPDGERSGTVYGPDGKRFDVSGPYGRWSFTGRRRSRYSSLIGAAKGAYPKGYYLRPITFRRSGRR